VSVSLVSLRRSLRFCLLSTRAIGNNNVWNLCLPSNTQHHSGNWNRDYAVTVRYTEIPSETNFWSVWSTGKHALLLISVICFWGKGALNVRSKGLWKRKSLAAKHAAQTASSRYFYFNRATDCLTNISDAIYSAMLSLYGETSRLFVDRKHGRGSACKCKTRVSQILRTRVARVNYQGERTIFVIAASFRCT